MKTVYLDTSIILSLIKHDEPIYPLVKIITNQKHLEFVTSTIGLLELFTILARQYDLILDEIENLNLDFKGKFSKLTKSEVIQLIIEFLFMKINLKLLSDLIPEPLSIFDPPPSIDPIKKLGINISHQVNLKTLDNYHLSTVWYHDNFTNKKIAYLVTGDDEFISKSAMLKLQINFLVLHPTDFVKLECP